MRPLTRVIVPAAALALGLTACANAGEEIAEQLAEQIAENAGNGDVDVDFDSDGDGSVTVQTSEGTMQFGSGGEIPDGFPEGLGVPEGNILSSSSFAQDEGTAYSITLQVETADFDGLLAGIRGEIESNGWTIESESNTTSDDSRFANLGFANSEYRGTVTVILSEGAGISVTYAVGPAT